MIYLYFENHINMKYILSLILLFFTITLYSQTFSISTTDSIICVGESTTLTITTSSTPTSILWFNASTNDTLVVSPSVTSNLSCTVVIGSDTLVDNITIVVNPLPSVFAGSDTSICSQSSFILNGSGAAFYSWNNGITNGVSFQVNSTLTYTVQGVDNNGCTNTDQITVTSNPLPTVFAGVDQAVCLGDSVKFTANGALNYNWSNGLINGEYFIPTATMTLTVTGTNVNGCSSTDQVIATVNPLPTINVGPDLIVCKGQMIALSAISNGTVIWGGGVVNNLPFTPMVTTFYGATATSSLGCINTDDVKVTVGDYPIANFYTSTPIQYCPNTTFDFVNYSTGGDTYLWDFGDVVNTSSLKNPSHSYNEFVTLTYLVKLVVTSDLGCKDSIINTVQTINDSEAFDVIIPTGFSPNNDSDNDTWDLYGLQNYLNSKVYVYNRWGINVFEGNELKTKWDGTFNGVLMPTADYYYIIELSDGRKFKGIVTLKQ